MEPFLKCLLIVFPQILPELSPRDEGEEFSSSSISVTVGGGSGNEPSSSSSPYLVHAGVASEVASDAALLLALPASKCESARRAAELARTAAAALALRHGSLAAALSAATTLDEREAADELFGGMFLEELLDVRTVEQVRLSPMCRVIFSVENIL